MNLKIRPVEYGDSKFQIKATDPDGTTALAKGYEIHGVTVYNMYGINATLNFETPEYK